MTTTITAAIGLLLVLTGWLMGRWASRYDIKGWVTGALWRMLFRGNWKGIQANPSLDGLMAADPELRKTVTEKAAELKADHERMGMRGAVVKHGGLFLLARLAGMLSMPLLLVGILLLGFATYGWLR